MKVNPINTINNQMNFRARIQPTESLREGFDMMEKYSDSCIKKDMDSVKDFLDSLATIIESDKLQEFKIEIDKRRAGYTYTKINGRRTGGGHNDRMTNLQDSYLAIEGIKNYASKLGEAQQSPLDILKTQVEEAERKWSVLKERYSKRLKAEFNQAKKMIFDENVK